MFFRKPPEGPRLGPLATVELLRLRDSVWAFMGLYTHDLIPNVIYKIKVL